MPDAVQAEGVLKYFGEYLALDGVDLRVAEGEVFGLLGPNGAGKTTFVKVLTTLLRPDGGHAEVFGADVATRPAEVRRQIGLAGQYAAVDELLTGRENLAMFGRLYRLSSAEADRRGRELLKRFDLAEAGGRTVKTYSGGMRRRLDLAASLVNSPRLLFLDEPTTGLDPRSRSDMWDAISELVATGTTVLLTTQYLEEADALADRIGVIDRGHIVAEGTSDQLKTSVGGRTLVVRLADADDYERACEALADLGCGQPHRGTELAGATARAAVAAHGSAEPGVAASEAETTAYAGVAPETEPSPDGQTASESNGQHSEGEGASGGPGPRAGGRATLTLPLAEERGVGAVAQAATALSDAGIEVNDLSVRQPTLDDVFLQLTDQGRVTGDGSS
jgi:ABC-2 type transport system ATP-binding protein